MILGALAPHPPIIVPAVGREQLAKAAATRAAMEKLSALFERTMPETIVVFSPHGNVFADGLAVTGVPVLEGSLAQFGDHEVQRYENDLPLAEEIVRRSESAGLTTILLDAEGAREHHAHTVLDHGVLVPLSFLGPKARRAKLVVAGMAFLPLWELYRFGQAVAEAAEALGRRIVVLASGDLSHRLTPEAPAGYEPRGLEFDRQLMELLGRADTPGVLRLDPTLAEKAGECGYRTIVMMLGALDGREIKAEILGYEGPFGVGYGVAVFHPGQTSKARLFGRAEHEAAVAAMERRRCEESPYVRLARATAEAYIRGRDLPIAEDLPPEAARRAGVFVSIKKYGQLRGCIGTISPRRADIAHEIRANAIAAATEDPRFAPIRPDELPDLVYSVDILGPPEKIDSLDQLDPERYGVIVRRGGRTGLLLPKLEGIEDAAEQVEIAKRKAGISPREEAELERFEVARYY